MSVRAKALGAAGELAGWLGNVDRGETLCQQSLALLRESGDVAGVGEALIQLGTSSYLRGDLATARMNFEEGLKACKEAGDKWGMACVTIRFIYSGRIPRKYTRGH